MRLIDADKLIEAFRDFKEWEDDEGNCIHRWGEWQRIDKCINITQEQPTAYDVDKISEKIRNINLDCECRECPYITKCDEIQENVTDRTDLCAAIVRALCIDIIRSEVKP